MARPRKRGNADLERNLEALQQLGDKRFSFKMARGGPHGARGLRKSEDLADALDACRRAWQSDSNILALFDALMLSAIKDERQRSNPWQRANLVNDAVAIPRFVLDELITTLRDRILADRKLRARLRRDMIDFRRWDEIESVHGDHDAAYELCFAYVAESLIGTAAEGSEDMMRRSWQRVKRTIEREPLRYPGRYYLSRYIQLRLGPREVV